jgi:hypothetical protein
MTYTFTARGEEQAFEAMIEDYSNEIMEVSTYTARSKVSTIQGFAVTVASYALDKETEWPYLTIPHFERRMLKILESSNAHYISWCPLVESSQREQWKNYTLSHQEWIPDYEEWSNGGQVDIISGDITVEDLHEMTFSVDEDSEMYFPAWQVAPLAQDDLKFINMNHYSTWTPVAQAVEWMHESRKTTFSNIENSMTGTDAFDPEDDRTWPVTHVLEPVKDDFWVDENVRPNIVGFLSAIVPLHTYFENVLVSGKERMNRFLYLIPSFELTQFITSTLSF